MPLLEPLTREEIAPELRALWDECEKTYPDFRNSWATMAHSPILFQHVWGQLLALKKDSPVEARHFEIAILIVSNATHCDYCIAHHSPRAVDTGLSAAQLTALTELASAPLAADHAFAPYPGFDADESLVIDLARIVVATGLHGAGIHPRIAQRLRRELFDRLAARFSPRQIEELVWRSTQCAAFNWHNELLELDLEPEIRPWTSR